MTFRRSAVRWKPTRFFSGNLGATGNNTLYTVPAGMTAIVTDWSLTPIGPCSMDLYTAAYTASWGGHIGRYNFGSGAQQRMLQGFWIAHAGDQFVVTVNSNPGSCWQTVHGYLAPTGTLWDGGLPTRVMHSLTVKDTDTHIYIVPTGRTFRTRCINMTNIGGSPQNANLRNSGGAPLLRWQGILGHNETIQLDTENLVITSGDTFLANNYTSAGNTVYYINGVLL